MLGSQVVELGQLRSNAAADTTLKETLTDELDAARAKLHESHQQMTVLAEAGSDAVGDDGARALPLLLLEAIRQNPSKAVLSEQVRAPLLPPVLSFRYAPAHARVPAPPLPTTATPRRLHRPPSALARHSALRRRSHDMARR